jgi:hypothetical protein
LTGQQNKQSFSLGEMFLNAAKLRISLNPSEHGTRFFLYRASNSVGKKIVKDSYAELQEFRANFEVVSQDHELKSKGAICLLFGSWLFELALFWIWIKYSGTASNECMSPVQIASFMGLYLLPVILFVWYLIR